MVSTVILVPYNWALAKEINWSGAIEKFECVLRKSGPGIRYD